MRASVNTADQTVRADETIWPFRVDLHRGCALIALDDLEYAVRAQSWQEKLSMSRFLSLGEAFLQASFLECCVEESPKIDARHRDVLMALAMWINRPDSKVPGLALDHKQLSRVTLEVCRSMGVGPAAIAELPVPEVESLWRSLEGSRSGEREGEPEHEFDYKVVVVPDAAAADEAAATAEQQKTETETRPPLKQAPQSIAAQARFRVSFNNSVLERRGSTGSSRVPNARRGEAAFRQAGADVLPDEPTAGTADAEPRRSESLPAHIDTKLSQLNAEQEPTLLNTPVPGAPQTSTSAHAAGTAREHLAFPAFPDPAGASYFQENETEADAAVALSNLGTTPGFPMEFATFLPALSRSRATSPGADHRPGTSQRSGAEPQAAQRSKTEAISGPAERTLPSAWPSEPAPAMQPDLDMESLLDEFCRRLDDAATDLGIFEEA